jgi:hypothetical protein
MLGKPTPEFRGLTLFPTAFYPESQVHLLISSLNSNVKSRYEQILVGMEQGDLGEIEQDQEKVRQATLKSLPAALEGTNTSISLNF